MQKSYVEAFASGCLGLFVMTDEKKIVIIGCGAGGGTAAQFARKTDRKAKITVIEKGPYTQYSKCGLPYTISGRIPEFLGLIEYTVEWFQKMKVEVCLNTEVSDIDMKGKVVLAKGPEGEIKREFDELIIATGAEPFMPPIKGIKDESGGLVKGCFVVRTIDDAKAISARVSKGGKAVVVGAGLIGLEVGEALVERGMDVTVVEALPQILGGTLDSEMGSLVQSHLEDHGMAVKTDCLVAEAHVDSDGVSGVVVKKAEESFELKCSLLIVATGVRQTTGLAQKIGCTIGEKHGIVVDAASRTSVDCVYAVGDCTQYKDFVTGDDIPIGLGSIVVRQAIAAGINAAGGSYEIPSGVLLTRTSEFFGLQIGGVGPCGSRFGDIETVSGKFAGSSLPEYVPGGKSIVVKVEADVLSGDIVGAQTVGSSAAQRANVFAAAILGGLGIEEFRRLETAYAPAVAPTLDALTLATDMVAMKLARKKRKK